MDNRYRKKRSSLPVPEELADFVYELIGSLSGQKLTNGLSAKAPRSFPSPAQSADVPSAPHVAGSGWPDRSLPRSFVLVDRGKIEEYKRDIHLRNGENLETIASLIEDAIQHVEDDESVIQLEIQMATSDLQSTENLRSSK